MRSRRAVQIAQWECGPANFEIASCTSDEAAEELEFATK
jgi:hypothetical protein